MSATTNVTAERNREDVDELCNQLLVESDSIRINDVGMVEVDLPDGELVLRLDDFIHVVQMVYDTEPYKSD